MILGIHHTAISVSSLDRSLAFYCGVLGAEVCAEFEWRPGEDVIDGILGLRNSSARTAMLRFGNVHLELFEYHTPTPEPQQPDRPVCNHGYTHVALEVRDIRSEYQRLVAAGMAFHCEPQFMGDIAATYGRDPDGNVIELQEVLNPKHSTHIMNLPAYRER
ncbi:MAG TPA: VOC family protein [Steroidobacteraceae bacterium]|nr:VOC family protein [Steroidobacteraceae bacterium]